jgi:hypothetical protein
VTEPARDFQWMRPALDLLYDEISADQARDLLYNESKRFEMLGRVKMALLDRKPPLQISTGELGDNLFQGLLAIRVKFAPDEGRQKVELNIAMRQRSR